MERSPFPAENWRQDEDPDSDRILTFFGPSFAKVCATSDRKLTEILQLLVKIRLISVKNAGPQWSVQIHNYQKYKDKRALPSNRRNAKRDPNGTLQYSTVQNSTVQNSTVHIKETAVSKSAAEKLRDIWNDAAKDSPCSAIRGLSKKRLASAKERLKENPDPEYWREVVKKVMDSEFCRGNGNGAWKANFDWLVRPDTHLKVMEGFYDNRAKEEKEEWW